MKHLRPVEPEPVPEVVRLLEETLDRARRGEVIAVALAMGCTGRCDATAYALGASDLGTLVLACERVKARLLAMGAEQ